MPYDFLMVAVRVVFTYTYKNYKYLPMEKLLKLVFSCGFWYLSLRIEKHAEKAA
jgi:hypothetical protein